MPIHAKLEKAKLIEMWVGPDKRLEPRDRNGSPTNAKVVEVQFNPQTLKMNYSNQKAGGDQPGTSPVQFVGSGTTKLTLELWFDVTLDQPGKKGGLVDDVRKLTEQVAYFMIPEDVIIEGEKGLAPPGIRFQWGSFLFDGFMDSMDETLDFFSEDGRPLRASVTIGLSKQELKFRFVPDAGRTLPGGEPVGTRPLQMAKAGDSLQQMASRAGLPDWKAAARANGIENPRRIAEGTLLNLALPGERR